MSSAIVPVSYVKPEASRSDSAFCCSGNGCISDGVDKLEGVDEFSGTGDGDCVGGKNCCRRMYGVFVASMAFVV